MVTKKVTRKIQYDQPNLSILVLGKAMTKKPGLPKGSVYFD